MNVEIDDAGAAEIAARARGTPRTANNLLWWVRDYVQVKADGKINGELADRAERGASDLVIGADAVYPAGEHQSLIVGRVAGQEISHERQVWVTYRSNLSSTVFIPAMPARCDPGGAEPSV